MHEYSDTDVDVLTMPVMMHVPERSGNLTVTLQVSDVMLWVKVKAITWCRRCALQIDTRPSPHTMANLFRDRTDRRLTLVHAGLENLLHFLPARDVSRLLV